MSWFAGTVRIDTSQTRPNSRPAQEMNQMAPTTKEGQRAELHKMISPIAYDLRGPVDGWDIESYVLGKPEPTRAFVEAAFRDGQLRTTGTDITRILPPVPRFNRATGHGETKKRVLEALTSFYERFCGLGSGGEA